MIRVAITVDDVHPEVGFGRLMDEEEPFKYMKRLNNKFGLKFDLFVVPFWQGRFNILNYPKWCEWIYSIDYVRINAHGLMHYSPTNKNHIEFKGINKEDKRHLIEKSMDMFAEQGIYPFSFRSPGWYMDTELIEVCSEFFDSVAHHFVGDRPIRLSNGLKLLPYTTTIDKLDSFEVRDKDTVVIQCHIAGHQNTNNLTGENINKLEKFLKGKEISPIFLEEL